MNLSQASDLYYRLVTVTSSFGDDVAAEGNDATDTSPAFISSDDLSVAFAPSYERSAKCKLCATFCSLTWKCVVRIFRVICFDHNWESLFSSLSPDCGHPNLACGMFSRILHAAHEWLLRIHMRAIMRWTLLLVKVDAWLIEVWEGATSFGHEAFESIIIVLMG